MPGSVVVFLSSIPPRFDRLGPTLQSLLAQDLPADAVIQWIPRQYRRFPGWDGRLSAVPDGVTILRCASDPGPAAKVLPALLRFAGRDAGIAFCDDDRLYRETWLSAMLSAMAGHPGCCIAAHGTDLPSDAGRPVRAPGRMPRAHHATTGLGQDLADFRRYVCGRPLRRASGYADLLHGYAGALVRPEFFPPAVHDIPPVLWAVDDVWLSGQLEQNGVPIWVDDLIPMPLHRPDVMRIAALQDAHLDDHDRRAADRACIRHFRRTGGIWKPSPAERLLAGLRPLGLPLASAARQLRTRFRPGT